MRIRRHLLLTALFVLPLAAGTAQAENRAQTWEFGPYLVFTDFDSLTEIEDATGPGFRFGYNFTQLHEIEVLFDTLNSEDTVSGQIDVHQGEVQTNYVFNFNFQRRQVVIPYFTTGFGFLRLEVDAPGTGSNDEVDPEFNFGGGVRFFMGRVFNVRLDFRFIFFEGGNEVLQGLDFQNNQFSIGVGWVVPAPPKRKP
ncbi:MAG: porin family protein [Acidobacteria bacterium]|nr:porin family protein [Acidobacteriota bacterium]MCI0567128.1 porin family protein [Acidobacteriota bacterium]